MPLKPNYLATLVVASQEEFFTFVTAYQCASPGTQEFIFLGVGSRVITIEALETSMLLKIRGISANFDYVHRARGYHIP